MLLVPRQLRRVGMTGDVPYYGGRFTPAQAYAASHPRARPAAPPPRASPRPSFGPAIGRSAAPPRHRRDHVGGVPTAPSPRVVMTGPVQVLVVGFEKPSLSGEILAELTRLGDAGIVRLLDVLLVSRTEDGHLETLPAPPGAHPDLGQLATAFLTEANDTQTGHPERTRLPGRSTTPCSQEAPPQSPSSNTRGHNL